MRNKKNKKNILLIGGLAAALLLSGCSSGLITNQIVENVQGLEELEDTTNFVNETVQNAIWDEVATEIEYDEDLQNIEWDDVKDRMAQKKQKIEVHSTTDDSLLHTIADNKQIFEFTKKLHIERWKYLRSIPEDAKDLLVYVTWSEKTKTVFGNNTGELHETSRNTLYKNKDGYYMVMEPVPFLAPIRKFYSKVPANVAEYLLSLVEAENK
ncbi:hypothetical protein [Paenibacillus alvei]|uniref:Lipoprotein n=1 Tax=Paenibacillus alvei TaxID=44250 RepID=A0AAP7A184_PAEAL|nr:hypothetical protein [Paenibacillus alvei]NOJ71012.1 hypothetical protein [Paenibacillus alvei]